MDDIVDTPVTEGFDVDAYLHAVGVERAAPDLDLLERLHHAHVFGLPFSNVDVLLGTHPGVEASAVQRRLVADHRGGYCFQHTQLFAAALVDLGYDVALHLGRVRDAGQARTHLVAVVTLDGRRYLTDPGFGFSITGPIPVEDGARRDEGGRVFSVATSTTGVVPTWRLLLDGGLAHVDDALPVMASDIRVGHHYTSTSPVSRFTSMLTVMRHTAQGHVTITHEHRTVRTPGAATTQHEMTPAEVVDAVQDLGVRLVDDEPRDLLRAVERLRG